MKYWGTNIESTLSLLGVMDKDQYHSIIFSKSATVYKPQNLSLLQEENFLEPPTHFGKTKLTIEIILKYFYLSNINKWRIANPKYFNPVGVYE